MKRYEKAGKVLSALGHPQRLDILRAILSEPMNGTELVERLSMGTTGQLYHHLKALLGADLLVQEERGGKYAVPVRRVLPMLVLLASVSDLIDTSHYMEMTSVREQAEAYMGAATEEGYNVHHLVMAVVENCILEHQAGYCTEAAIYLYEDGSVTVADNGRGIPVHLLPQTGQTHAQSVLTNIQPSGMDYVAPGGEKGVSIAVVNAMSQRLVVEIRKEGRVYRQEYRNGIPQTDLLIVGTTKETGTSITLKPNAELFQTLINIEEIRQHTAHIANRYPELDITVASGNVIN